MRASHPGIAAVYLMGQFNNGSTVATPMTELGERRWEAMLPVVVPVESLCLFVWEDGNSFGRVVYDLACDDDTDLGAEPPMFSGHQAKAGKHHIPNGAET